MPVTELGGSQSLRNCSSVHPIKYRSRPYTFLPFFHPLLLTLPCKMQQREKAALYKATSRRNFKCLASACPTGHVHTYLFCLRQSACSKYARRGRLAAFPMTVTAFTCNNLIVLLSPLWLFSSNHSYPLVHPADHHAPPSIQQRNTVQTLAR